MPTPDEQKINALRFALSQKIDAARAAQAALMTEQRRQGLAVSQEFFTADEMDRERAESRLELREIVNAAICDTRVRYDRTYTPDAVHQSLIALTASFGEALTRSNVVPLASAREIIEAGRKRRGDQ